VPAGPYPVCLDDAHRAELESVSRRATAPFRLVLRARIVLLAADGLANSVIAAPLGICADTARKWRRRYRDSGLDGLADAPRPGPSSGMPHWPTTFEGLAGPPKQPGSWKLPPHWRPPRENGGRFCLASSM
jgi:hypothetical protein